MIDGPGDVNGDGRPDLVARGTEGAFYLLPGLAGVGFGDPARLGGTWQGYDTITGHGDFNGDGKVDLLVRAAGSSDVYVKPGRGNGRFGHPLGPVHGFGGVTALNAGASAFGATAPDLLARSGDSLVLFRNAGTYETGTPVASGLVLPRASDILSAGDWDRDGAADMIVRNRKSDRLLLYRGDGAGHFAAPTLLARGFRGVKLLAAVGDMTGDGWPDLTGQPAGHSMMIYPGNGTAGLQPAYAAFRAIKAGVQVAVGRWDGDGAPDSLFRARHEARAVPRQRTGRLHRISGVQAQREAVRLDGGCRRHGGQRPLRSGGAGEEDGLPVAAARDHDGLRAPGVPRAGLQGVRPGGLVEAEEAVGAALVGRDPLQPADIERAP